MSDKTDMKEGHTLGKRKKRSSFNIYGFIALGVSIIAFKSVGAAVLVAALCVIVFMLLSSWSDDNKETKSDTNLRTSSSKINDVTLMMVENLLKQAHESAAIINTTVTPKTFWHRLHFLHDVFLELQKYENYGLFKGNNPSADYEDLRNSIESIVDSFIDRVLISYVERAEKLDSQAKKDKYILQFVTGLLNSFDNADMFWSGNNLYPHFNGPLFTQSNYDRVQEIYYDYFDRVSKTQGERAAMALDDIQKESDRKEYIEIVKALGDDAPKSFGAYRRMKNSNSSGFQKLKQKAAEYGIEI